MKNKRKREQPRPAIHPRNKYSEKPPDFALLASFYPSFKPFVFYSRDGRPRIDWTDFNATRELTRILLHHDHGINWWIPDGQLCPTVPNRSNYIHWIEDLLLSDIIPRPNPNQDNVRGFDIGTGANCIYPLLGASLLGWRFVGSDVADVAIEWAERNVKSNPQISDLIEIRKAGTDASCSQVEDPYNENSNLERKVDHAVRDDCYSGPPILYGVVRDGETFDFCMCNPPFFESMEEAGLNPKTSCGGTVDEMVCPGGEKAFITRIIEDSVKLKHSFRWYTSMVGRKINLKFLTSKLREVGVTIVKTTEFVQGQTCRWGIAWSFVPPVKKIISTHVAEKPNLSFMLQGLQRQSSAFDVLQSIESFFRVSGASCKLNVSSFCVDISASNNHLSGIFKEDAEENLDEASGNINFRISVFQQIPGTLLVKGSLQQKDCPVSGELLSAFQRLEVVLKDKFCQTKDSSNPP
ncbi:U6 small nuclear RNA (adenine-(43)-N(6))-methyltransferase isoform X1 [Punica granatum]|uniref:U6 small nuclear RNA (adenine-(43)-N(6))-methyltransferase n=1 Tax=Punica granatum TaxID=22663 RepID=A0A6P8DK16_PUNGR|nr:U6 small nuclear RNA (adenine-(43)-N(6))-methyltransferase isoform X1 [Punica granatum]